MKLLFREAMAADIPVLISMLADDDLGSQREDSSHPLNEKYLNAFGEINSDPNNELILGECNGEVIGMLQLTFIPYLSHMGSWRCLIESVRIHSDHRGQGLGTEFFKWAIERAKQRNCRIVQLTSDKSRPSALHFYEALGFNATHQGFKLKL
jgi:GNAT superfamily N-acetyltransferase